MIRVSFCALLCLTGCLSLVVMMGCSPLHRVDIAYRGGIEDRDTVEDRYSFEVGPKATFENGHTAGFSYRWRGFDDADDNEHGFFVAYSHPLWVSGRGFTSDVRTSLNRMSPHSRRHWVAERKTELPEPVSSIEDMTDDTSD